MKKRKEIKGIALVFILTVSMTTGCIQKKYLEDGVGCLKEEKYEEAVELFQKEVEQEKNLGEAYRGMGMAYYELKDYEKAEESFQQALESEAEETGTIYNFIGLCCMQSGRYDEAIQAWNTGVGVKGTSDELKREMMWNTISAYEEMRDWERARNAASVYLAEYPEDEKVLKEAEFLETR